MPPRSRELFQAPTVTPAVKASKTAAQSLTSGAQTIVAFPLEIFDTHGMHDLVTNNSRLTCVVPGLYSFGSSVEFAVNATGLRVLEIILFVPGSSVQATQTTVGGAVLNQWVTVSGIVRLDVGNYLEAYATQFSGGALNISPGSGTPNVFWAYRVGP